MKKIQIVWLTDTCECEVCGTSFAQGGIVTLNDEIIVEMLPLAHCYDGADYSEAEVYKAVLEKLGYVVKEV